MSIDHIDMSEVGGRGGEVVLRIASAEAGRGNKGLDGML